MLSSVRARIARHKLAHAALIGVIALLMSGVLYIPVLELLETFPWWHYPRLPDGGIDPAGRLSMQLAFAQVYTGFVAVFIAGTLGWLAIQEFSQSQARPELGLIFNETGTDVLTLNVSSEGTVPGTTVSFAVHNTGNVVAVWYMVQLNLSPMTQLLSMSDWHYSWDFTPVAGDAADNWAFIPDSQGRLLSATFLSNGAFGAYPRFPLVILQGVLPNRGWVKGREIKLTYTFGLEREIPQSGQLHIKAV